MTAARHARPRPAAVFDFTMAAIQTALLLTALLGVLFLQGAGANVPGARWHYPCRMHRAAGIEWFTPARDFWKGLCLQP